VANDRIEEAEGILRKAAKHGEVQLPYPILHNHLQVTVSHSIMRNSIIQSDPTRIDPILSLTYYERTIDF